jgi:hypothetical protein
LSLAGYVDLIGRRIDAFRDEIALAAV